MPRLYAIWNNNTGQWEATLIERWEAEKGGLQTRRDECLRKLDLARQACNKLNWTLPDTPGGFAEPSAGAAGDRGLASRTPGAPRSGDSFRPGADPGAWQFGSGRSGSGCVAAPSRPISQRTCWTCGGVSQARSAAGISVTFRRRTDRGPCPGIPSGAAPSSACCVASHYLCSWMTITMRHYPAT